MDSDIFKFEIAQQPPPQYESPFLSYEAASHYCEPVSSFHCGTYFEPPLPSKVVISGLNGDKPMAVFHKQAKRILI